MDKMRGEFERMCHLIGVSTTKITVVERGVATTGYQNDEVNEMFGVFCFAWQASRAALCVQMPRCCNEEQDSYRLNVLDSLDDAGVSYE